MLNQSLDLLTSEFQEFPKEYWTALHQLYEQGSADLQEISKGEWDDFNHVFIAKSTRYLYRAGDGQYFLNRIAN